MKLPILIPAYQPGPPLIDVVTELSASDVEGIIIVDDGSGPAYEEVFAAVSRLPGVIVLSHASNLGKGAALKTGIDHADSSFHDSIGVVTADADGQHVAADILHIARALVEQPHSLVLGVRRFEGSIPLRSRIGNLATRHLLRLITGCALRDTQTGLRGIPRRLMPRLLKLRSRGFEFELEMLMLSRQTRCPILQTDIRTVYPGDSRLSHFRPLLDSMRICFTLFRFLASAMLAAAFPPGPITRPAGRPPTNTMKTDWDAYYASPCALSRYSRRITGRILLDLIRRFGGGRIETMVELGGAGSCFVETIRREFAPRRYCVIDNNPAGLEMLRRRFGTGGSLICRNENVLELKEPMEADVVFSVGLVEHFSPADTRRAIRAHFSLLRPGGLAIITFPTPTWLYLFSRRMAEVFGLWRFPDERPLPREEVLTVVNEQADVLLEKTNWPIVFTQRIIAARCR